MRNKSKGSKLMFYTGIAFVIGSAILLLGGFMRENTFPIVLGVIGVIFIAASNFRLLNLKK